MPYCGPSNAVPSCAAVPTVGFGSGSGGFDSGFGCEGYGIGSGGTTSAASLGVLRGADPRCIVQLRSQEAVIHPSPVVVTLPGPILSSSLVPLRVGGYNPCGVPGSGSGFGSRGFNYGNPGELCYSNHATLGRRSSFCLSRPGSLCH